MALWQRENARETERERARPSFGLALISLLSDSSLSFEWPLKFEHWRDYSIRNKINCVRSVGGGAKRSYKDFHYNLISLHANLESARASNWEQFSSQLTATEQTMEAKFF